MQKAGSSGLSMKGAFLVGDVVDEVAKWCAEEVVNMTLRRTWEPDETLHLLIFLLKRHDKAKYGYLLDLFKAHYPEVEVPLFAKTYHRHSSKAWRPRLPWRHAGPDLVMVVLGGMPPPDGGHGSG